MNPIPTLCGHSCALSPLSPNLRRLAFAFLASLWIPAGAMAQGSGDGRIEGRVFNARTQRYLNNARVTVDGTSIQVFTDQFGEFQIYSAPLGEQILRVSYTGLQDQTGLVVVESGETVEKDFTLRDRVGEARSGEEQIYELEEFVVGGTDYQSFSELAIQEERYSINLKNVVAADAYGTVAQGNVGEFVKFIPGVQVDYGGTYASGADASSISVRGFNPDQTAVTIDGIPVSNAQPGSLTRSIGLDMLSINNASRVEVIKVPTPDQPTTAIGGTVNLVSKTAFEYFKPTLSYRLYFAMNSENLEFWEKTPGPVNKSTYKTLPGLDLTYAVPLNDKFGFSITLATANQFNENHSAKMDYQMREDLELPLFIEEDGTRIEPVYADLAHPYLNNFGNTDSPRISNRHSAALKLDYRPWDGHLITANYQISIFESRDAARRFELNAGGTAGIAAYGPDFLESKPGSGKADNNVVALDRSGSTQTFYLKWDFIKGPWDIRANASFSTSDSEFDSLANNHFSEVELSMGGIEKSLFEDIVDGIPGKITYYDENGDELDPGILSNYNIDGYVADDPNSSTLRVKAGQTLSKSEITTSKFDLKRDLDFLPLNDWMRFAVKGGVYYEERLEEKWGRGTNYVYQYLGESGVTLDVGSFLDTGYQGISPGFGFKPYQWPDVYKVYSFFKDNQDVFSDTHDVPFFDDTNGDGVINYDDDWQDTAAATNWAEKVNTEKRITEENTAYYWQLEGEFFNNRLSIVGGMRQEWSSRSGRGRLTDGSWNKLRKPVDEDGDGLLDLLSIPTYGSIPIDQGILAEVADLYEAAGAVYPDGTPFRSSDAELINVPQPRGPDLLFRGTRIGPGPRDFVGYIVPGTLRAKQYQFIPNYEIAEESKGKPSPIISGAYDLTENIVLRVSWSKGYAKPAYEGNLGILRRVEYNPDQTGTGGSISIGNPALKPWTSTNWDFGISYYTDSGGQISFSYYTKSIVDFHVSEEFFPGHPEYERIAKEIGLGQSYIDNEWTIETTTNGEGTATTSGYEVEVRQDLSILGSWGKTLYFYASYTTKEKSGNQDATDQIGQTSDDFAAGGLSWNWWRLSARVNATWRNENIRRSGTEYLWPDPSIGDPTPDGPQTEDEEYEVGWIEYEPAELKVDVNFSVRLRENLALDFAARNITNTFRERKRKSVGGDYPAYAQTIQRQEFGINFTIGLSGTF